MQIGAVLSNCIMIGHVILIAARHGQFQYPAISPYHHSVTLLLTIHLRVIVMLSLCATIRMCVCVCQL